MCELLFVAQESSTPLPSQVGNSSSSSSSSLFACFCLCPKMDDLLWFLSISS